MSDVLKDLKTVNLLLVGRTGNGKSSTGNSILGSKVFTPRSSSSAIIVDIRKGSVTNEDHTLNVVDGPGIGDTGSDAPDDGRSVIDLVDDAMKLLDYTFTALLITFKYGVRFTKQERDAVSLTKSIFGDDVVKNFGIIVMTHGDSFDLDNEDESSTFENWCKEQTGDVQSLFQECDNRCVLFNNKLKDDARRKEQFDHLMAKVAHVHSTQKKPYTRNDFDKADKGRKKLLVMSKLPELDKRTENFLDGIKQSLDQLEQRSSQGANDILGELDKIQKAIKKHKNQLEEDDQGTGSVDHLLLQISIMETSIRTKTELGRSKVENERKKREFERRTIENGKIRAELGSSPNVATAQEGMEKTGKRGSGANSGDGWLRGIIQLFYNFKRDVESGRGSSWLLWIMEMSKKHGRLVGVMCSIIWILWKFKILAKLFQNFRGKRGSDYYN